MPKTTDQIAFVPPDEGDYPSPLTEKYELIECFSADADNETLLARGRADGGLYVAKCYRAAHPLYAHDEPEALKTLCAPPMPRFVAEYKTPVMRCVLREYVTGETLAARAERLPFTQEEIIAVGMQLCDQLTALHTAEPHIIHRDIKPQNVILRPDGAAVLIDFGISRVSSLNDTDTFVFGTQGFAPPEQYGYAQTDARSDIFSLGVLLHWLLKGKAAPLLEAATPLEQVIKRCTAFDPKRRYASAARVKAALYAVQPQVRRKRVIGRCLLGILLAAVLGVGLGAWVRNARRQPVFAQPLIESAVRLQLGLTPEQALTRDLLPQVKGLYIMADTAYADADQFYAAINQWYADGKPVRGTMDNLSDAAMLPALEEICIAAQEISDISTLAQLPLLTKVELKHNQVADISALAGHDRLVYVGINENPVRDLSPLIECPRLVFLDLCDVRAYDPQVLSQLGNFDYLDISNPTNSYRYLGEKSVLSLSLGWTGITSLEDLRGVTRLEELNISHTAVTDLAPLAVHSGLKRLNLAATPVKDLSVLLSLPLLERVTLSHNMAPLAEALGEVEFEVRYE